MQTDANYISDSAQSMLRPACGTCDNCRLKKVRCPGQHPACSRCLATNQGCHYSPKKRMGRPRTTRSSSKLSGSRRPRRRVVPDVQSSTRSSTCNQLTSTIPSGHIEGTQQDSNGESGPSPSGQDALHSASNRGPAAPYFIDFEMYQRSLGSNPYPDIQMTNHFASPEQHTTNSCACLSTIYLLLDQLKSKHQLSAPDDLAFLQNCVKSAVDILTCPSCPRRYLAIIQNAVLLGVFCLCIAESYARILDAIDEEEKRARNAGIEKQLVVQTEANDIIQYSYSPTTNATASFSVNISPAEWGSIMRQIVKKEIFGAENQEALCLVTLLDRLEQRQKCWHDVPPAPDCPPSYRSACGPTDRIPTCLRLVGDSRMLIRQLKL